MSRAEAQSMKVTPAGGQGEPLRAVRQDLRQASRQQWHGHRVQFTADDDRGHPRRHRYLDRQARHLLVGDIALRSPGARARHAAGCRARPRLATSNVVGHRRPGRSSRGEQGRARQPGRRCRSSRTRSGYWQEDADQQQDQANDDHGMLPSSVQASGTADCCQEAPSRVIQRGAGTSIDVTWGRRVRAASRRRSQYAPNRARRKSPARAERRARTSPAVRGRRPRHAAGHAGRSAFATISAQTALSFRRSDRARARSCS